MDTGCARNGLGWFRRHHGCCNRYPRFHHRLLVLARFAERIFLARAVFIVASDYDSRETMDVYR